MTKPLGIFVENKLLDKAKVRWQVKFAISILLRPYKKQYRERSKTLSKWES